MIDLRSDTATQPTPGMRQAMANAEVGDDMMSEDPTVRRLEERVAALFGKESSLFVPSGTMANQIAIAIHCRPGEELLCEAGAHLYHWEAGGPARLSGVTCRLLPGRDGILDLDDFLGALRPEDQHYPRTRMVALENTHNKGGGTVQPIGNVERIGKWTVENGLAFHLDGARLLNAVVATQVGPEEWASHFDSLTLCFSKGLGAPVGSILVGKREFIAEARRVRKVFGGAMRQVGILAAGCLYALDHHVDRLAEDHAHARRLAEALADHPAFRIDPDRFPTNILWIPVDPAFGSAEQWVDRFRAEGVLVLGFGSVLRMVTHLDVSPEDVERVLEVIAKLR